MPNRASITQTTQIGVETTPGTVVPASKKLASLSIEPQPQGNIELFAPAGMKFNTVAALGQEWMQGNVSGAATYTELVYALASVLRKPTITTPAGATDAKQWAFNPLAAGLDDPATYTIEQGDSVRAHRFSNAVFTAFGLNISRQKIDLSGTILGRAIQDGITKTASPTDIALIPILPSQISIYVDDNATDIGTTKLSKNSGSAWGFVANLQISDRWSAFWPLDAALDSFAGTVDTMPTAKLELTMEADAAGMKYLDGMRKGDTAFVRIEAIGAEIETGVDYTLSFDMAAKVGDMPSFEDQSGIYAVKFPFELVYDSDLTKALSATVINKLAAL